MNLYELTKAYEQLLDAVDEQAQENEGEVSADLESMLSTIEEEREQKIINCAKVALNFKAKASAIKAEMDRLKARKEFFEKQEQHIKDWMNHSLEVGEKVQDALLTVSCRKSQSVNVIDEAEIPEAYMREKITHSPDKKLITQTIKEGGSVPGAELTENKNILIK